MFSSQDYYGNQNIWFVGEVVDDSRPQAVRVRVFGVHPMESGGSAAVSNGDLPWAPVVMPSDADRNPRHTLKVMDYVYGIWADGKNMQQPIVVGRIAPQDQGPGSNFYGTGVSTPLDQYDIAEGGANYGSGGVNQSPTVTMPSGHPYQTNTAGTAPALPPKGAFTPEGQGRRFTVFKTFYDYFLKGMQQEKALFIAAGILTSIQFEVGGNINAGTDYFEKGSNSSGLCQWRNKRKARLIQQCGQPSNSNIACQASFAIWEINNTHKHVQRELINSTSPEQACDVWTSMFEVAVGAKCKKYSNGQCIGRGSLRHYSRPRYMGHPSDRSKPSAQAVLAECKALLAQNPQMN